MKMKYIVLLLAFPVVSWFCRCARPEWVSLVKTCTRNTIASFPYAEAKATASSECNISPLWQATGASAGVGGMDNCQNCVYVLERIKQGYQEHCCCHLRRNFLQGRRVRWKRCLKEYAVSSLHHCLFGETM